MWSTTTTHAPRARHGSAAASALLVLDLLVASSGERGVAPQGRRVARSVLVATSRRDGAPTVLERAPARFGFQIPMELTRRQMTTNTSAKRRNCCSQSAESHRGQPQVAAMAPLYLLRREPPFFRHCGHVSLRPFGFGSQGNATSVTETASCTPRSAKGSSSHRS